jgi:hypothetical protein
MTFKNVCQALDCPSIWESRDPRLSTQIARCAGQLASTCCDMLLESDRVHLLRIVLGLQTKAWTFGARDVPPLSTDDGPLDHYNRTWSTLQTVCTRTVELIAASAAVSAGTYMAHKLPEVLEAIMPMCSQLGAELALLEVCVRQADMGRMVANQGSVAVIQHVHRLMLGKCAGGAEEGGDEWVMVDGDENGVKSAALASHKGDARGPMLQVQVDALVFLVHLLSDPSAIEPWRDSLAPTVLSVLSLARQGAGANIAAQHSQIHEGAAALSSASSDESREVKQDVPAKRALGPGDDVCKDVVQHVSKDAVPAPAITVVSVGVKEVGVKETPVQPSTVDGAVVCQTALEAVYLALVPELSAHVCSAEVVAAVEALFLDALALPQGTIRQLMCLVIASCAQAVCTSAAGRVGGGASFEAPHVLVDALLARVDDSQDEVRAEALNSLAALLALQLERGVVDKVRGRVAGLLKEEEDEQVREAAQALLASLHELAAAK